MSLHHSIFIVLSLILASVSGTSFGADDVRIALDWTPNTNHIGIYVAKAEGFFKSEGINPIIIQPNQTTATKLVAAGQVDVGISFMSDMFKARARGLPVRVIAAIIQENTSCFAWRNTSGIKTVKDWEGKRYGGWGSPEEEATLKFVMKKYGADFAKLKIVTTGIGEFVPSTQSNADIMWIYMGWSGIQAKLAKIPFSTLCAKDIDPLLNKPSPLIISSEKLQKENPELLRRFMRAVSKGFNLAIKSPGQAAKDLVKEVPELDVNLVTDSAQFLSGEYGRGVKRWGILSDEKWTTVGKWMLEQKLIDKLEPPAAYYTNEFLPHD